MKMKRGRIWSLTKNEHGKKPEGEVKDRTEGMVRLKNGFGPDTDNISPRV